MQKSLGMATGGETGHNGSGGFKVKLEAFVAQMSTPEVVPFVISDWERWVQKLELSTFSDLFRYKFPVPNALIKEEAGGYCLAGSLVESHKLLNVVKEDLITSWTEPGLALFRSLRNHSGLGATEICRIVNLTIPELPAPPKVCVLGGKFYKVRLAVEEHSNNHSMPFHTTPNGDGTDMIQFSYTALFLTEVNV